ncbi:MAG: acyltransferase [Opitutaceae bacterium]
MTSTAEKEHMPQLDGLRAVAFVWVAVSHWTPHFLSKALPWGTGVQLFFVLSGFLITGILLRARPADLGISLASALKVFYARRMLRIFPLYYGVLALCLLFAVEPIFQTWPWHVSYLSNFYYTWHPHGADVSDPFLHLWSLSVEEQFYLLWPLVVLVASPRVLPGILIASIVGSTVFRVSIAHLAPGLASIRYLTPSCLDALAVGGLIAYAKHTAGPTGVRKIARVFLWLGLAGLVLAIWGLSPLVGQGDATRVGHTFLVIVYGALVAQGALGFGGITGQFLRFQPVLYLGKISYGLYVYHYFAPLILVRLAKPFGWDPGLWPRAAVVLAYSGFTLLAAMASWHLYEFPINRLKRHFLYPGSGRSRSPATSETPSAVESG